VAGGVFVTGSLQAAAPAPEVVAGLSAEAFKTREWARQALLDWAEDRPEEAKRWLFKRWKEDPEPEVRRRCLAVLRELVLRDYLQTGRGYLGILMQPQPLPLPGEGAGRFGIRVTRLVPGSPAAKAGLVEGDVIAGVDDQVWREPSPDLAFSQWVQARPPGRKVVLRLWRDGRLVDCPLVLGRRPDDDGQAIPASPREIERMDRESRERYFQRWLEERGKGR
jgi:hypothetical protein